LSHAGPGVGREDRNAAVADSRLLSIYGCYGVGT